MGTLGRLALAGRAGVASPVNAGKRALLSPSGVGSPKAKRCWVAWTFAFWDPLRPASMSDRSLSVRASRARCLAMLALNAGSPVSAERLIDGLWGEQPPATAAKMVQVYVSQLRKALAASGDGAEIVTRGRGYELRLGTGDVDARRFERLVAEGAPREALALWRGPPLDDVATEPFAALEIRRLQELRLAAVELAVEHDLAAGRHVESDRRARGVRRRGAAARAPARPADAGAVSLRPAG